MWTIIAKSLGDKSGKSDEESDKIALIRLFMFLSIFITNSFIIFGVTKTHIIPTEPRTMKCVIVNK